MELFSTQSFRLKVLAKTRENDRATELLQFNYKLWLKISEGILDPHWPQDQLD